MDTKRKRVKMQSKRECENFVDAKRENVSPFTVRREREKLKKILIQKERESENY